MKSISTKGLEVWNKHCTLSSNRRTKRSKLIVDVLKLELTLMFSRSLKRIALLLGMTFFIPTILSAADSINRSKSYQAINKLSKQFAEDIEDYGSVANTVVVTEFSQSSAFEADLRSYMVFSLEQDLQEAKNDAKESSEDSDKEKDDEDSEKKASKPKNTFKFVRCFGCFKPRAISDGKDIYIRKGFADNNELKFALEKIGADAYMTVNLDNNGDEVVMQTSLFSTKDSKLLTSKEYRTTVQGPSRSGVVMGIGMQSASFHDSKLPSVMGARISIGQRLVGLGDMGVAVTYLGKNSGYPSQTTFSLFTDLNRAEITGDQGKYVNWLFPIDFGVTDFNGDVQFQLQAGVKMRLGSILYVSLTERQHVFLTKPRNDGEVKGTEPVEPEGDDVLFESDKPISGALMFGVGVDFTF
ncbi:hypothetical protein [Pseudobacteriovorax antillogorgiicola]|uniref:Uncharacterized protein n=1 Tax=Pseudobacteriovorax antillogorgiicola TaxID=1513793 RepID=A0A1Y6B9G3_9BACT|nr:hypothetical protein [Pseudobacteriovorax antillogorgiicola]TCS57530.1 hypothetical protein EDD56_103270 [Pseudobacteriovorax antillogorgiicola]SMF00038.1 hypothetical protein SAMN06296036_10363 [Pseudobacteriovorax antillogorgiicola]